MPHTGLISRFSDPDAYASSVHNCDATLALNGRGRFAARLALARLPAMGLCLAHESLPRRAMLSFPPDRFFFRLVAESDGGRTRNGSADVPGSISARSGDQGVEDVTTLPAVSRSVSVPIACMHARAELLFDDPAPLLSHRAALVRPPPAAMRRLIAMHQQILLIAAGTETIEDARIAAMQTAMWNTLVEAIAAGSPATPSLAARRGHAIMRRVIAFIAAHDDRPVSLTELCAVAGCSAKSLETLFLRSLGETPIRYMRRWRLWRVRRALAEADPREHSVSGIATDFGFWELGRFSAAYRALFGETPSRTLHAAASSTIAT